jgi:hypothetical protein
VAWCGKLAYNTVINLKLSSNTSDGAGKCGKVQEGLGRCGRCGNVLDGPGRCKNVGKVGEGVIGCGMVLDGAGRCVKLQEGVG